MGFLNQVSGMLTPQNTFNAGQAPIQQQNFQPQIAASQAGFNQNQAQQQMLAQQLLAQSQGAGPNIAQMQLQQATDANIKQGAGMVASQRGISPELAARQAAQNAAGAQQQAAGQSGMLRANQQLEAQGQLGGLYGQMGGQQLQNQGILQGAQSSQNQSLTGAYDAQQQIRAQNAQANTAAQQKAASGIAGGAIGGAGALLGLAHGGFVPMYAAGGMTAPTVSGNTAQATQATQSSMSKLGQSLKATGSNFSASPTGQQDPITQGMTQLGSGLRNVYNKATAPDASPLQANQAGEKTMPSEIAFSAFGGDPSDDDSSDNKSQMIGAVAKLAPLLLNKGGKAKDFKPGGAVPGKASVKGDSLKNDTVPAMVSPGEIVIPRSITQGKNAPDKAAQFVAAVLAKKGKAK